MNAPQQPERPRRAFLEPPPKVPFYKTKEGRFLAFFLLLFVLCSVQLFVQYRRAQKKVELAEAEKAKAAAAQVHEVPLEEKLAKKREEISTIFEGALADTKNGDQFVETAGYARLIQLLALMTPEETAARAKNYADFAEVIKEPDLVRGEFVKARGLFIGISAVKLDNPVGAITDVWRGVVAASGDEAFTFDFIGEPPTNLVKQETVVEVDGLLYRTVTYEGKTHEKKTAPYLLARNIRVLDETHKSGSDNTFWAIVIGLVAIAGYLLVRSLLRGGRRSNISTPRLRSTLSERRRATGEQPH